MPCCTLIFQKLPYPRIHSCGRVGATYLISLSKIDSNHHQTASAIIMPYVFFKVIIYYGQNLGIVT